MEISPLVMYRLIGRPYTKSAMAHGEVVNRMSSTDLLSHCHVPQMSNEYCVPRRYKLKTHVRVLLLLSSSFTYFHDLKFCLSSQLKAASCAIVLIYPPASAYVRNLFSRLHWTRVGPFPVAGWYGHLQSCSVVPQHTTKSNIFICQK